MKWYLVRNRTSDILTMKDLLDDASRGKWTVRGHGSLDDSEEIFNALVNEGLYHSHSETVVRILDKKDKERGVFVEKGLWEGERSRFIVRKIDSPRHIWTETPKFQPEDEDEEETMSD
ncbi:MAG: hypothetical protein ACFFF4_02120 [Candidatus Thorarchaeota archaeon]